MDDEDQPQSVILLVSMMADLLYESHRRVLALSNLLIAHGVISAEELSEKMNAMSESATLAVEFSDKPENVAYRNLRRIVREMQEGEEPGDEPDTGPHTGERA